jgi:hypothetical protein
LFTAVEEMAVLPLFRQFSDSFTAILHRHFSRGGNQGLVHSTYTAASLSNININIIYSIDFPFLIA